MLLAAAHVEARRHVATVSDTLQLDNVEQLKRLAVPNLIQKRENEKVIELTATTFRFGAWPIALRPPPKEKEYKNMVFGEKSRELTAAE